MKSSNSLSHLRSAGGCLVLGLTGWGVPLGGDCLHPLPVSPWLQVGDGPAGASAQPWTLLALTASLLAHPAPFLTPAKEKREEDALNRQ